MRELFRPVLPRATLSESFLARCAACAGEPNVIAPAVAAIVPRNSRRLKSVMGLLPSLSEKCMKVWKCGGTEELASTLPHLTLYVYCLAGGAIDFMASRVAARHSSM